LRTGFESTLDYLRATLCDIHFNHDYYNEKLHLTQFGGKQYDVGILEDIADKLPTTEFSLED